MSRSPNIIILGASSLIARWLVKRLTQTGFNGQCFSRKQIHIDKADTFTWNPLDKKLPINLIPESIVVSLLPLWLLPLLLPQLHDCQQLIVFSTTSIFSKKDSPNPEERKLVNLIQTAEKTIIQTATVKKIPWTILRPTLIYDGRYDQNITAIAKFIQRWKILPVASPANGLRQPVHADDVAAAVVSAIKNPASYNRSFNIGGGEILTYRQMVQRVFQAMEKPVTILPLPPKAILATCWLLNNLTSAGPNAAMFQRMNQDLAYDFTNARQDLNYKPRPFQPDFHIG